MRARIGALSLGALGFVIALGCAASQAAEGEPRRGSVLPGSSQDGSRPNEGAIVGGSIESEQRTDRAREAGRCRDLEGSLRRQCLADVGKGQDGARK